jgi:MYXO-CTERM domain-containing protein
VAPIPLPPAILLSIGALGLLAAAGRRRRRPVDLTPGR